MDFKQGGQVIQRIRKKRGLTQEQLAEKIEIEPNSISRIERGLIIPALPTLIAICNALEVKADVIIASYILTDTLIHPTALSKKFVGMDLSKQAKIETILNCVMETIQQLAFA